MTSLRPGRMSQEKQRMEMFHRIQIAEVLWWIPKHEGAEM